MKLLTQTNCSDRLAMIARPAEPGNSELRVDVSTCLDRSAATARLILALLGSGQTCFIWIREFGIWPFLENWDLFNSLRGGGDDHRSLLESPGCEFDANEADRFVSCVQVMLLNGWGGILGGVQSRQRIAVSHDSWISIQASDALPSQTELIEQFGLDHVGATVPLDLVKT